MKPETATTGLQDLLSKEYNLKCIVTFIMDIFTIYQTSGPTYSNWEPDEHNDEPMMKNVHWTQDSSLKLKLYPFNLLLTHKKPHKSPKIFSVREDSCPYSFARSYFGIMHKLKL